MRLKILNSPGGDPFRSKTFCVLLINGSGFPGGSVGKNPLAMQEMQAGSLSLEDLLEGELAIYSSILTWKIPWTEKPGGL